MKYETEVREIISQIVNTTEPVDSIGIDTDLQNVGMDSLAFVEIISEIENLFDIEVPNEALVIAENGKISNLCKLVDSIIGEN